jgi:hypothetical protein
MPRQRLPSATKLFFRNKLNRLLTTMNATHDRGTASAWGEMARPEAGAIVRVAAGELAGAPANNITVESE